MNKSIERWGIFEEVLKAKVDGNPFVDIELVAVFSNKYTKVEVQGFYDGNDNYIVRFMPQELGEWTYIMKSNCKELNNISGKFICVKQGEGNHGPLVVRSALTPCETLERIMDREEDFHFSYADGKPHYSFGTTCYA